MKKYINIIPIAIIGLSILFGCEKSNDTKDFSASIKDKTWWGTITYTGQTTEYFSVHFNADSSLLWSQFSGDYPGKWKLKGNRLTLTFSAYSVIITADISDDNKWTDITDNTGYYDINSGEMNKFSDILLDNTEWKGDYISAYVFQMSFLPGSKVDLNVGGTLYPSNPYSKSESDFIRIASISGYPFFGVFISTNELRGCIIDSEHYYQATKQ